MPSATKVADDLANELKRIERARIRVETVLGSTSGVHLEQDIERLYGGLFIGAVIAFERFLEDLFVGLLVSAGSRGLVPTRAGVVPYVKLASHARARLLLLDRPTGYANWLPYDVTENRALLYFRNGVPFSGSLSSNDRDQLHRMYVLRNSLAHKSRRSLEVFENVTLQGVTLPPRDRTPERYLRSQLTAAPPRTRFEVHLSEIARIGRVLTP